MSLISIKFLLKNLYIYLFKIKSVLKLEGILNEVY